MKITIEIPDDELKEALKAELVHRIVRDNSMGGDRRVFRREYGKIVKEMIYQPDIKADIIQQTVENATGRTAPESRGSQTHNTALSARRWTSRF